MLFCNSTAIKVDTYQKLIYCTVNIKKPYSERNVDVRDSESKREHKGLLSEILFICIHRDIFKHNLYNYSYITFII